MELILQGWIGRNSEGNLGLAEEILVSCGGDQNYEEKFRYNYKRNKK